MDPIDDFILWYCRSPRHQGILKFHSLYEARQIDADTSTNSRKLNFRTGKKST